jgi:3-methylcrotonyl-CoA carboxylase alpha subunit
MAAVGVPVAPGYHGEDQSPRRFAAEAERIGFPLIIKASAGGGGKGMQVVWKASEVASAVESAQRLARTAFADDRLLMERYFPEARHVEVQIFADRHGEIVTLFDRDCSIQRRHQKIIEEAPAPDIRDEVRAAMAKAAIDAARAVSYVSAGTIEFLVDPAQKFYFMEMNTRLQVEHPVTELITGIDLVEWQLRIAQGEPLPLAQADIVRHGAAVESRLYAEDPAHGYLPSVGTLTHLRWPDTREGLRVDSGVDEGDTVSSYYDPMLGKVISWAETRSAAIERLRVGLAEVEISGVTTNRALLTSVLGDSLFRAGAIATNFLELRRDQLRFGEPAAGDEDLILGALWYTTQTTGEDALWRDTSGWRLSAAHGTLWRFADRSVQLIRVAGDRYLARCGVAEYPVELISRGTHSLHVELNAQSVRVKIREEGEELHLYTGGAHVVLRTSRTDDTLLSGERIDEGSLLTPLPGTIVAVHVMAGQEVKRGDALVTVEAMKMEHTLTAPSAGRVTRVVFGLSERVLAGAVLVELSAPGGS